MYGIYLKEPKLRGWRAPGVCPERMEARRVTSDGAAAWRLQLSRKLVQSWVGSIP